MTVITNDTQTGQEVVVYALIDFAESDFDKYGKLIEDIMQICYAKNIPMNPSNAFVLLFNSLMMNRIQTCDYKHSSELMANDEAKESLLEDIKQGNFIDDVKSYIQILVPNAITQFSLRPIWS